MPEPHGLVPPRDSFQYGSFGPVTNALALNNHVDQGFGAEISHVSETRFDCGVSR